jgi:3-dehydroquinate synthetase
MQSDKKSKDATLRFIILDGIGKVKIVENVDKEKILISLKI